MEGLGSSIQYFATFLMALKRSLVHILVKTWATVEVISYA